MEAVSWSSTIQAYIVIGIHIFHFRSSLVMAPTRRAGCRTKHLALVIGCVHVQRIGLFSGGEIVLRVMSGMSLVLCTGRLCNT